MPDTRPPLAAAAQRVADLYEMGAGGDDWWTALDHLVAALRSVSADSTDPERCAWHVRCQREVHESGRHMTLPLRLEALDYMAPNGTPYPAVSADSTAGLDVGQIAVAIANAYVEHDRHRSAHTDHKGACQYPRPLPSWLAERIVVALTGDTGPKACPSWCYLHPWDIARATGDTGPKETDP